MRGPTWFPSRGPLKLGGLLQPALFSDDPPDLFKDEQGESSQFRLGSTRTARIVGRWSHVSVARPGRLVGVKNNAAKVGVGGICRW